MSVQRVVYASIIAVCAGTSSVSAAVAQSDSTAQSRTWLSGVWVGVPGYDHNPAPEIFTVGLHQTYFESGHLVPEVSIGTAPVALLTGTIVLGGQANLALAVPLSEDVFLLPGAGLGFIGWMGRPGTGGTMGPNFGLSTIIFREWGGWRMGVTWQRFIGTNDRVWLAQLGFIRAR